MSEISLIGKKIGMTREFFDSGIAIPVTVVKVEKGRVIDVITKEKRGYDAVKIGYFKVKNSKLTKQMKGFFVKKNTEAKKILKEYRVEKPSDFKEGNELGIELLKDKKYIEDMYDEIQDMTHELERSLDKISEFRSNFEENLDIKLEDIYNKYEQVQNKLDMLDENMNGEV